MANRLRAALDAIEQEHEAPIYALERLRLAISEDCRLHAPEAKRLRALDKSGAGPAFGRGWMDFMAFAMKAGK
ncbi:MAG: hypothetical protein HC777_03875 [Hyphomonadaceae bacterium]|nr:hypothetical protein [Hyphomonadaceae bacterium]